MRRLWFNGRITTMDGELHRYEALGTDGDRIVYLGGSEEARRLPWDEETDLAGAQMLPAFNDSHMHLLHYCMFSKNVSLFGVDSVDSIIRLCRERIERDHPASLVAVGWNQDSMREGRMVNRADLDKISTEIPICAVRACIHIAACNTPMIRLIEALGEQPEEIEICIDHENGMLRENAARIYMDVLPTESDDSVRDMVRAGQKALNAAGITAIHSDDLQSIPGMDPIHMLEILRGMEEAGELSVRIYEQCLVSAEDFSRLLEHRSDPGNRLSLFRTGPRKLLQDGSLGARSAEMIDGYADERENHGIANYTSQELYDYISAANAQRMDVAVHAIGDLALKKVCDTFARVLEEDPWPDHRHGIVHAQTTTPDLLKQMKDLGLQAFIQPIFIDSDMEIIEARVGAEHAKDCYIWKTMRDMGIPTSGGSDCPVEPFNVLDNMRAAINRRNRSGDHILLPEEALTTAEAIRLFTADAAWAARDEDVRGTLEKGKLADLVVVDRDLFETAPQDLTSVRILETVLGGSTVFRTE